jgi:hypothetical protein
MISQDSLNSRRCHTGHERLLTMLSYGPPKMCSIERFRCYRDPENGTWCLAHSQSASMRVEIGGQLYVSDKLTRLKTSYQCLQLSWDNILA